ncbi:hypothetical protein RHSIM_Rhsim10G0075900 [Rhododendron simsii]|uniref:Uncharacterized protein n=1 Tax=Rhododendron simsii TaxID=118357 RepID=A0A834LD54_RHOSS|nr:hypothetical protein RHSIM_Rhsim10G0075900 [Rhododendron simsii]
MADVLLSSLLQTIFTTLNSSALQQFGIAWGLERELNDLASTLSTIQAVLVDAEAKQWTSEPIKNWLRKLKDSAYDADNVLDEFATEALKRKLDSQIHQVSAFFSLPNWIIFRFKMGNKIKDVEERLDKIAREKSHFHLTEGLIVPKFCAVGGRQTSSFVNEAEILGRNDEKERIINMLLDDLSDRDGVLGVCAVRGMGGVGKTTLARLVYNDKRVEGHFGLRLWVCVSVDCDIFRLTGAIDLKVPGNVRHLLLNSRSARGVTLNEAMLEVSSLRSFVLRPNTSFSWEEVSTWISKQKYLRVLDLRSGYCTFVKVPRLISNSNHLRYLDMSYSDIVYVPESICDLQNLETLKLENCRKLQKLPKGMRYMRNLIYLDIKGCYSLISMPPKLGQLTSLRRLSIFIVGQAEGYRIGELKELNLAGELEIYELDNVRSPADAENANLKRKHDLVSLELCWSVYEKENLPNDVEGVLESLQPHSNLKQLSISYYRGSKFPNWMMCSVLRNLVELSLYSCSRCKQLPPLGKLHSLKKLDIWGMDSLKCLDPEYYGDGEISFQALETLSLLRMPSLEEWTTMDRQDVFPRLRKLDIKWCPELTNLPVLPTLERLEIGDNEMLLKSVDNLTSLSSLKLYNFQLEFLPAGLFQNHEALESLTLQCMRNIETLQNQMSGLSSLKRLGLHFCDKLGNLQGLETLNSLNSLFISGCNSLTDLKGLEGLTSLRSLIIKGCPEIQSFPEGMRHLNSLQHMDICDCEGLITLPNWLGSLQSLSRLSIWGCRNLRSMPDELRGQKNLREMNISSCPDLERRCKKESGEDWLKIAHIPIIKINGELVQSLDD